MSGSLELIQLQSLVAYLGAGFLAREMLRSFSGAGPEDPLLKLLWSAIVSAPITLLFAVCFNAPQDEGSLLGQLGFAVAVGTFVGICRRLLHHPWWDERIGWRLDRLLRVQHATLDRQIVGNGGKTWFVALQNGDLYQGCVASFDPREDEQNPKRYELTHAYQWSPGQGVWVQVEHIFIRASEISTFSAKCPLV